MQRERERSGGRELGEREPESRERDRERWGGGQLRERERDDREGGDSDRRQGRERDRSSQPHCFNSCFKIHALNFKIHHHMIHIML